MKLFFATDVHGSEICWKKFVNAGKFYETDVIILGGDMTGKAIVPNIVQGNDKYKETSFSYATTVLTNLSAVGASGLTWLIVLVVTALTVINAVVKIWLLYYVGKRILAGAKVPLVTLAGLVFFLFLDWLLVEWFRDPHVSPFDFAYYAIGRSNVSSMLFMLGNYALAAAIYIGFSALRRGQGIDVSKVYKAIPVE
jgi:hypothetical protein